MPSAEKDDWSDSDDESSSEVETSVLLGVPDGPVDTMDDLKDAAVSRIGGRPVRTVLVYNIHVNNLIHFLIFAKNWNWNLELLTQGFLVVERTTYSIISV